MNVYLGLMSGTSMDGIDAALVNVDTHECIAGLTYPYDPSLAAQLQAVMANQAISPGCFWQLHTLVGKQFAAAANALIAASHFAPEKIIAIGSHGQTLLHDATAEIPYTIQLGCPHTIANLTGMTVVADFRTRDLVVGGKGAPFAPLYHQTLFAKNKEKTAIVNVGGISNMTFLIPGQATYGYDLGPGNCLMDAWMVVQRGEKYDQDGAFAASGRILSQLLQSCLQDPYFQQSHPKSICKSYFSLDWLQAKLTGHERPEDVQATLNALTARCIVEAVQNSSSRPQRVAVCGGGAHNLHLLQSLKEQLNPLSVINIKELGVDPDFLEAMMFGWLAHQALNEIRLDLSQITGAKKASILGVVYKN